MRCALRATALTQPTREFIRDGWSFSEAMTECTIIGSFRTHIVREESATDALKEDWPVPHGGAAHQGRPYRS